MSGITVNAMLPWPVAAPHHPLTVPAAATWQNPAKGAGVAPTAPPTAVQTPLVNENDVAFGDPRIGHLPTPNGNPVGGKHG